MPGNKSEWGPGRGDEGVALPEPMHCDATNSGVGGKAAMCEGLSSCAAFSGATGGRLGIGHGGM